MKLASLKGGRDGRLVVVSRDLTRYCEASNIAPTLQKALDDWAYAAPRLEALYRDVEHRAVPCERFHEREAASPLPRAYQFADGSAYMKHVELVRKARGAEVPKEYYTDPMMYQGGSDAFLAPRDAIPLGDEAWGCDFEGEIAAMVDDVPMGASPDEAGDHVKLLMLCNDVSLRNLIPGELAKGFGFFQSKPPSAFSPVAVTPDELEDAWHDGRIHLPLHIELNGRLFGKPNAGTDATFTLADLIAHAARTRPLSAGTIVGSGTVSNRGSHGGPGKPVSDGGLGYSCIAEQRMVETILGGEARTPFLRDGDTVAIEMKDSAGHSLFGRIEQVVQVP